MEEKYMSFEEHRKEIKDIKRKRSLMPENPQMNLRKKKFEQNPQKY